jgi:L-ascorbate metabolism protein UlaG (beta-lactamase superfamily)
MSFLRLDLIGHSGFALECENCVLVFDLYLDPSDVMQRVIGLGKPVVFFSSHSHHDHWSPDWLDYKLQDACYIVDSSCVKPEILRRVDPASQRLTAVEPYQCLYPKTVFGPGDAARFLPGIEWIRTFGSTDMGVSFLLRVDGRLVFHAGDLNDWYWAEESTEKELESYELAFRRELRKLCDAMDGLPPQGMDLAFFPVDSRLGEHAFRGALIFISRLAPSLLAPMHLCGDVQLPEKLAQKLADAGVSTTEVLRLTEPGHTYRFESGSRTSDD